MSAVMKASEEMELSEPAVAKLRPEMTPQVAVETLMAAGFMADALKLLARLLPKRYAVAWLCQCARGEALNFEDKAAASLAEKWVRDPSEANRRAAFDFADAGGYKTFGSWLAAAAGWSGGSLGPASQAQAIPPPEHLTACAAVAAVTVLSAKVADQFEPRQAAFMAHAMNLLPSVNGAAA